MPHFETEKYYESEKDLPKISQSDFATNPTYEIEDDVQELLKHLYSLEPIYKNHFIANNNIPDSRVCNEILFSCNQLFSDKFDICLIYSTIIDFFGFDNVRFFNSLNTQFKYLLKQGLSKRMNIETFERMKRREETNLGGSYTPSFMDLIKR